MRRRLKAHCRKVGKLSAAGGRDKALRVRRAALDYLGCAEALRKKLIADMPALEQAAHTSQRQAKRFRTLRYFFGHLAKHIDLLRRQHVSVESAINALEHHGLNRCPDRGIAHFKNYTAVGVLAYNLHQLGNILLEQDRKACPGHSRRAISKNRVYRKAA
mgnify:CR=1 FL=1